MTRLIVELPDNVAREAELAGVLFPETIARLVEEEVRRRQAAIRFGESVRKMHAAGRPAMRPEEIQAEIESARKEQRRPQDAPGN